MARAQQQCAALCQTEPATSASAAGSLWALHPTPLQPRLMCVFIVYVYT